MDYVFGDRGSGKTDYGLTVALSQATQGEKVAVLPVNPDWFWDQLKNLPNRKIIDIPNRIIHFGKGQIRVIRSVEDIRGEIPDLLWFDEPGIDNPPKFDKFIEQYYRAKNVLVTETTPSASMQLTLWNALTVHDTIRILR